MDQDGREAQSGSRDDGPMTRAEFIAMQMRTQITPTKNMAASYFRNGLKKGSIRKVGPDQYVEGAVAVAAKLGGEGYDPTELYK